MAGLSKPTHSLPLLALCQCGWTQWLPELLGQQGTYAQETDNSHQLIMAHTNSSLS